MEKIVNNKSGFTFIESLITFSIVGIFLALTWATVNFLLLKTSHQIVRTYAHFLAVEGVEVVRQIRQTSVNENREKGFVTAIGSKVGDYVIVKNGERFELVRGEAEVIEMQEEPYKTYCRTINLNGEGEKVKQITVSVRWDDCNPEDEAVSYSTYLAKITQ